MGKEFSGFIRRSILEWNRSDSFQVRVERENKFPLIPPRATKNYISRQKPIGFKNSRKVGFCRLSFGTERHFSAPNGTFPHRLKKILVGAGQCRLVRRTGGWPQPQLGALVGKV
jgi:hypothetical protein